MILGPANFENLLRDGSLKEADRNDDENQQFVTVATDALHDAKDAALAPHNRDMMAYEGWRQRCMPAAPRA